MSFFFSMITWLLFYVCADELLKIDLPQRFYKASVKLTGLMLVMLTFFILNGVIALLEYSFWTFAACYLVPTIACMQLYKLPQPYTDIA